VKEKRNFGSSPMLRSGSVLFTFNDFSGVVLTIVELEVPKRIFPSSIHPWLGSMCEGVSAAVGEELMMECGTEQAPMFRLVKAAVGK
jgi:hypothetical protein